MGRLQATHHPVSQKRREYKPVTHHQPSYTIFPNAGISVCANQKLNTNFGPVINIFGVNPLKKLLIPSCLNIVFTILNPLSGFSKFRFWMRVLMTSNGAETIKLALAPAIDATKFCIHVAAL